MREPTFWRKMLFQIRRQWYQWTNRAICFCLFAVFTWENPCCEIGKVTHQDRHSTFNNSVRDSIRREAAENEVPTHEERLAGACRQIRTLRRRYERWCEGDDILRLECTHKQRYEALYQEMKVLQQNTWIDYRKFLKWIDVAFITS